jgi:hypothetical protein
MCTSPLHHPGHRIVLGHGPCIHVGHKNMKRNRLACLLAYSTLGSSTMHWECWTKHMIWNLVFVMAFCVELWSLYPEYFQSRMMHQNVSGLSVQVVRSKLSLSFSWAKYICEMFYAPYCSSRMPESNGSERYTYIPIYLHIYTYLHISIHPGAWPSGRLLSSIPGHFHFQLI